MCKFKKPTSFKICLAAMITTSFLAIIGFFFSKKIIGKLIQSGLKSKIALQASNVDQWGEIPGKYNLELTRNITFFNWKNPEDVKDSNSKLSFQLVDSVILQELNLVSEIEENKDATEISYSLTYSLVDKKKASNSRVYDQEITIPNLYAFGVWQTSKNLDLPSKAMNTFGSLYIGLLQDDVTYLQTVAIGVDQTFFAGALGEFKPVYAKYFQSAGISEAKGLSIYNDNIVGFKDKNTRKYWIQAVIRGWESSDAVHLMQYFDLKINQIVSLFDNLKKPVKSIQNALKNSYQCPGDECSSEYLTMVQFASQNITKHPPSGPSYLSIIQTNATAYGFPEISYFRNKVFYDHISKKEEYKKDCNFTLEQMKIWLNMTETGCVKNYQTLLHPTNIKEFMAMGFSYDNSGDIQDFAPAVPRFHLNNVYQSRILFEYLKYLGTNFSTVGTQEFELTLRCQFFTQGIMPIWQFSIDYLKKSLITALAVSTAKTQKLDCEKSITLSSPAIDKVQLATFCMAGFDENTINRLFSWCGNQTSINYKTVFGNYNFKKISTSLICSEDSNPGSFGAFYKNVHKSLSSNYGCKNEGYCTDHELIAKQWINGSITSNPPQEIQAKFPKAESLSTWFPKIIPEPFEFSVIGQDLDKPVLEDAVKFLFWENAFAQAVIAKSIAEARKGKTDLLNKKMFQSNVKAFENYINHFIINFVFGGVSVKSTVGTFMNGYTSPLMVMAKNTNPILGGDPSVDPKVPLVAPITVVNQTRKTGSKKIKDVDQYVSINKKSYINQIFPYFDGNKTTSVDISPWKVEDPLQGSDNIYPSLLSKSSKPVAYITDLCRYGQTIYSETVKNEKYGLESFRFAMSKKVLDDKYTNPDNEKYYMNLYSGAINLTSVQRTPVFASKLYMKLVNDSVVEKIEMLDKDSKALEFNEETDDVFVDLQPETGIPTRINFDLQTNVEIPFDTLFTDRNNTLLPVFILRRNMAELSDDQFNTIFGDVIKALDMILYLKIGFGGVLVGMVAMLFVTFSRNQELLKNDDDDDLGNEPMLNDEEGDEKKGAFFSGTDTDGMGSKLISAVETESGEDGL